MVVFVLSSCAQLDSLVLQSLDSLTVRNFSGTDISSLHTGFINGQKSIEYTTSVDGYINKVIHYYSDGGRREENYESTGLRSGFKEYDKSGKRHGASYIINSVGVLISFCNYNHGYEYGNMFEFYNNGSPKLKVEFGNMPDLSQSCSGQEIIIDEYVDEETGEIRQLIRKICSLIDGAMIRWDENGKLLSTLLYKDGAPIR